MIVECVFGEDFLIEDDSSLEKKRNRYKENKFHKINQKNRCKSNAWKKYYVITNDSMTKYVMSGLNKHESNMKKIARRYTRRNLPFDAKNGCFYKKLLGGFYDD